MESYIVKLDEGKISYSRSRYACDFCGWWDYDKTFFYPTSGAIYCSLHVEKANR